MGDLNTNPRRSGNDTPDSPEEESNAMDPAESDSLRDDIKGETTEHANPPRLEDEGQSGG